MWNTLITHQKLLANLQNYKNNQDVQVEDCLYKATTVQDVDIVENHDKISDPSACQEDLEVNEVSLQQLFMLIR